MAKSKVDKLVQQVSSDYEAEVTVWLKDDGFRAVFEQWEFGGESYRYKGYGDTVAEAIEEAIKACEAHLWEAVKPDYDSGWLDKDHEDAKKHYRG